MIARRGTSNASASNTTRPAGCRLLLGEDQRLSTAIIGTYWHGRF
jgi:hypothetical protein